MVVCSDDPEYLCIRYYEDSLMAAKISVFSREVKKLCKEFDVTYSSAKPMQCLAEVLNKTLNHMTDAQFGKIHYNTQVLLAKYGEALNANKLQVTQISLSYAKGDGY